MDSFLHPTAQQYHANKFELETKGYLASTAMSEILAATASTCHHCGEPCNGTVVYRDHASFCCQGCALVYDLLNDNGLAAYYRLREKPGMRASAGQPAGRFAYLDDPEVRAKLLDFSEGGTSKATFHIPQMYCSACIWVLEHLNRLDPGVTASRVNFPKKTLAVTFNDRRTSLRKIVELLATIGYEPHLTLDGLGESPAPKTNRALWLKLGLAGFAFGNVMLFSLPEYFDAGGALTPAFRSFFGYLNALLALPVLLYSSRDFFISALAGLRQKMLNIDVPISLGIVVLFLRSSYEVFSATGAGYFDSFTGLIFFLLIGKLFQQKTYDALSFERDYKSYFPISVTLLRNGIEESVPLAKVKPGAILLVRQGELIPADAELLSSTALIDYSFVTGEARPVAKRRGEFLFAGGRQTGAAIRIRIRKAVSQSYLTSLWNNDIFAKSAPRRFKRLIDTVAHYFTYAILAIAGLAALYWIIQGSTALAIQAATAVLIIACPCALALSLPFAFGNALRLLGRSKLYLKNTDTIEALARIDHIVFDKTGTLTLPNAPGMVYHAETATGPLTGAEQRWIKALVRQSTHPLSRQIAAVLPVEPAPAIAGFRELAGHGIEAEVEGRSIRLGRRDWVQAPRIDGVHHDGNSSAAGVYLAIDGQLRGHFSAAHRYRPALAELLRELGSRYHLSLLSGDSERERVALQEIFTAAGVEAEMRFEQSPADKLHYIERLQAHGRRVLMIGDGLNDAGALKQSDAGLAISEDISTFSPACDGILDAGSFANVAGYLRYARQVVTILLMSFGLSFLYNITGLGFAVSGTLSPVIAAILMPLSSISVVAFTTLATTLQAKRMRLL